MYPHFSHTQFVFKKDISVFIGLLDYSLQKLDNKDVVKKKIFYHLAESHQIFCLAVMIHDLTYPIRS